MFGGGVAKGLVSVGVSAVGVGGSLVVEAAKMDVAGVTGCTAHCLPPGQFFFFF